MTKPITQQTIADACGVSKNTVSLALRGSSRVLASTRDKILAKSEELGYQRDPQLSRIMTQLNERRKRKDVMREEIAYLDCLRKSMQGPQAKENKPVHLVFFESAKEFLESEGYRLNCYFYKDEAGKIEQLNRILRTRGIRGIIVSPLPPRMTHVKLNWDKFAAVAIGRQLEDPQLHRVDVNHANHCRTCFDELVKLGCKRIGLIMPRVYDNLLHDAVRSSYLGKRSLLDLKQNFPILDTNYPQTRELTEKEIGEWIINYRIDGIIGLSQDAKIILKTSQAISPAIQFAALSLDVASDDPVQGVRPNVRSVGKNAAQQVIDDLNNNRIGPPESPKLILVNGRWINGN